MNKKARSNIPLKPKAPFEWVFMDIIPSTAPKSLTNKTKFSNYLLIVDAYSKIPKLYGMDNITTEEVMDKLDVFQSIFGKIGQLSRIWAGTYPILSITSSIVIFSIPKSFGILE